MASCIAQLRWSELRLVTISAESESSKTRFTADGVPRVWFEWTCSSFGPHRHFPHTKWYRSYVVGHSSLTRPAQNLAGMADWPIELDQDNEFHDAWVADERQPQGLLFTPKVAPSFDGKKLTVCFRKKGNQ